MKRSITILSFLIASMLSAGCAVTHKFEPYFGKVVDAGTMQPLEGAAVAMVYYSEQYGSPGGPVSVYADAQETVTDARGEFKLPALRLFTFRPLSGWDGHPSVFIFKPGYGCYPWQKGAEPKFDYASLPANTDVTIRLPRLTAEKERMESLDCPSPPFEMPYLKARRYIDLINQERGNLGLKKIEWE